MKPILYNVNAFDKSESCSFAFYWSGNQSFKNRLVIRKNDTNEVVYNQVEETLQLKHTLPPDTLINGILYNACIYSYDKDNNESEASDSILFYCFTQPEFVITNITPNQIIQNSSHTILLSYSQIEGEELESYQVILYDHSKSVLNSSSLRYDTNNLSYTINGLLDNTMYYIQATGKTLNDMYIDTGLIPFNVDYITPTTFATLVLENNSNTGSILIRSNVISVEFKAAKEPGIFLEDEMVDLRDSDQYIYLDEAFSIPDDFSLIIQGKSFSYDMPIVYLSDGMNSVVVTLKKGIFESTGKEMSYFELTCTLGMRYIIYSNYFESPNEDELIKFVVQHKNGIFDILVVNINSLEEVAI